MDKKPRTALSNFKTLDVSAKCSVEQRTDCRGRGYGPQHIYPLPHPHQRLFDPPPLHESISTLSLPISPSIAAWA